MAFTSGNLTPIEQALGYLLEQVSSTTEIVEVELSQALGCVLAESQKAVIDVPGYDNSAMDGFAVNTEDLNEAEIKLPISQTIAAGYIGQALAPSTAARTFTGAPIPKGANAVVMQEDTKIEADGVTILETVPAGKNIRRKGHDIAQGEAVLNAGHRLQAQDMGLLSSLGISKLKIYRPLTVAIINTGDEIVSPDKPLKPGQIYDSNSYTLDALLSNLGFQAIKLGIIADDLVSTEQALLDASEKAACIITTGGVSVGDEDHVKKAVENLGQLNLWKLAIKPGKPFAYGEINGKPFFGLPGNPVAVFVTFVMLVQPYILKMQGATVLDSNVYQLKADFDIPKSGSRQEYIRVKIVTNDKSEPVLQSFENQGSSILTSLSWADGLAIIPIGETITKGELLRYIPFKGLF